MSGERQVSLCPLMSVGSQVEIVCKPGKLSSSKVSV